jgi:hypothetical protein
VQPKLPRRPPKVKACRVAVQPVDFRSVRGHHFLRIGAHRLAELLCHVTVSVVLLNRSRLRSQEAVSAGRCGCRHRCSSTQQQARLLVCQCRMGLEGCAQG